MNETVTLIFVTIIALILGGALGFFWKYYQVKQGSDKLKLEGQQILSESKEKASAIELEARDQALEIRQKAEQETNKRRSELSREEDRLQRRRDQLDTRTEKLERREQSLNKRQSTMDKRANEVEKLHEQQLEELQRISELSSEDARKILLAEVEKESRDDMARIIHMRDTVAIECCPHLDNRFLVKRPLARALLQMLNRGNSSGGKCRRQGRGEDEAR